ncbi:MAG: hypothetical protein BMS9Abin26_0650 [Gammaproteobacteria bacterium]|nr:MAG: hypothetical protein BMS9Abin26_0650 [Gammaproteobacteria bacterium]
MDSKTGKSVMKYSYIALAVFGMSSITVPAQSEVLSILDLENEPANNAEGIKRPLKGMSMDQVLSAFGAPVEEIDAVGEPPISRWVYDQYTVYFEDHIVIHSTVKH